VLDEFNILEGVRRIAGTSAGSITAAMLATGGGSAGLTDSIEHTHFSDFLKDPFGLVGDIKRIATDYGMHTADQFVVILKKYIGEFSGNSDLTFSELDDLVRKHPSTFKCLSIISSNLTRQSPQVFNRTNNPDLPIWLAVRASMSIPLLFEPVIIDGEYHVDGGLAWNYPIELYDRTETNKTTGEFSRESNPATLGFFLEPQNLVAEGKKFKTNHYPIKCLKSYGMALGSYFYETANAKHLNASDRKRTVFIDDLGISGTNFEITKKQVDELIASGRKSTKLYFESEQGSTAKEAADVEWVAFHPGQLAGSDSVQHRKN